MPSSREIGSEPDTRLRSDAPVEWAVSAGLTDYDAAVAFMEERAAAIRDGDASELVWLVEHPPLYTGGTSANLADLLSPERFPVFKSARGGQYTYHGPGQRVVYLMLDLTHRGRDVRAFVHGLEAWLIAALAAYGVLGECRNDRVGVWVDRSGADGAKREDKIAAIGVRVRRWVSFHGIALNVRPDLSHFAGIVPCGVDDPGLGVTSLTDLGVSAGMDEVDATLKSTFQSIFGPTKDAKPPRRP